MRIVDEIGALAGRGHHAVDEINIVLTYWSLEILQAGLESTCAAAGRSSVFGAGEARRALVARWWAPVAIALPDFRLPGDEVAVAFRLAFRSSTDIPLRTTALSRTPG